MTHEHEHDRDETQMRAMLRSVEAGAPIPDASLLASLRQRTTDEFVRAAAQQPTSTPPVKTFHESPSALSPKRRSSMLTLALRGAIALSAAVALMAVWLNPFGPQSVSGAVSFEKVLDELRGASTLQLQLAKSGQTSEILIRAPGLVRKQETPQRYQIATGSRLWKVDEAENTAVQGDSPWFLSPNRQVDLLGLLEVGITDASPLLVARPFQRTSFNGRDCFAYRVDLPAEHGRIRIEAFADAANNQLVGIIARDAAQPNAQPMAELRLLALNQPVGDEKFAVAKSLTEDGRIGKVSDAQGIVVLRPMLARRWTPVCRETLLRPGDWLRTELRGANAVKVTLSSEVELTLGPGTQIECISPSQARLHNGQVQVKTQSAKAADDKPSIEFTLLAPRSGNRVFKSGDKQLVRVDRDEKIIEVAQTPIWLAGFEGTTSNESLGSLIVQIDGRSEPLTVGYHKVSVEIRDQIARTTIEESFVNHTKTALEGVFHFPLPQDASISGFGMWIGNDLVEADVVEKQRAREIFETILREKRDPGLLEWMGGNIFKARVFPIEPHSEKRIKIVYTQVLPQRANRYRYSYGLRSELLRTKPLRELSLTVTVNSALPLKSVSCPTHTTRVLQTAHSAQIEFAAQEYTPTRDFEVVCEVDGKQSDVVLIPHRRGNDGYFLVQLTPPAPEGNWQRELLPDGKPLNVVLLCDTSASMDSEKRQQQAEFVGTVLTSLGDGDRFQLVCADVGTTWAANEPLSATAENIAKATAFLNERISLGWTNLDRAFADVSQKIPADAQVIYVGDGIVSAGTTDPAAFVQKLKQLIGAKDTAKGVRRTFHSVTVGNSYESVVLKGIAAVGGGSTRLIHGEQTPQVVALELLNEIAQPGLRDINVEFRGLKVAAVYPGQLPNVAAGTQQILVGRYLPEGKDQTGEVVVTGMRGDEKVKYSARVNLKDAEDGNSFIPRLWARSHLDQLLAQGQTAQVREEILELSEQFHIITPFTSLLVLESDADRERFGVKRRYEMRDGERFFAEGRNNSNFELAQAQMKRAGNWRLGLRRQILAELNQLGRNSHDLQEHIQYLRGARQLSEQFGAMLDGGDTNGTYDDLSRIRNSTHSFYLGLSDRDGSGGGYGKFGGELQDYGEVSVPAFVDIDSFLGDKESSRESDVKFLPAIEADQMSLGLSGEDVEERSKSDEAQTLWDVDADSAKDLQDFKKLASGRLPSHSGRGEFRRKSLGDYDGLGKSVREFGVGLERAHRGLGRDLGYGYVRSPTPGYTEWLNSLFPALASATKPAKPLADPETWTAESLAVSKSLLRTDSLRQFGGGVEVRRISDQLDPRWNRSSSRHRDLTLYSSTGWLIRSLNLNEQTIVNYATRQERGVYSLAFLLGRKRASVETDLLPQQMGLSDFSLAALHDVYRNHTATLEPAGENRVKLVLTMKDSTHVENLWIDTLRHVVVKHELIDNGIVASTLTYDDFVEVAGSWWARKSNQADENGLVTSETTLEIKSFAGPEYNQRLDAELAAKPSVQFISLPFVKLSVARQKSADGTATFDHSLAMILHNARLQQWDDLWKQVDAAEKVAADKPGVRWIRTILQATTRKNEDAQRRLTEEIRQLAAKGHPDDLFLAEFSLGQAQRLLSWPEFWELVQLAKPIYERQPADLDVLWLWTEKMAQCHEGTNQFELALALRRSMAESKPWNVYWQTDYAARLARFGQFDAAHAWLRKELDRPVKRPGHEVDLLCAAMTDVFRLQAKWPELLQFTMEWIGRKPESTSYNSAYSQHLSALVFNDQYDQACAITQLWLNESKVEGRLAAGQLSRLEAALNFALGNSHYLSFQRMDDRWFEPLVETARFFARHLHHSDIAARIVTNHQFQQSDVADRLRGEFLNLLRTDLAKLTPSQISSFIGWTFAGRLELAQPINGRKQLNASEVPVEIWQQIVSELLLRWNAEQDKHARHLLGDSLVVINTLRFSDDQLIPFLRERITKEDSLYRLSNISRHFDNLLSTRWTAEIEQEAFAWLRELSDAEEPEDRLLVQLPALYRLIDAMAANRQSAGERTLNDQGGQDKFTRKELAAKKSELRRIGRMELSARLSMEARKEDGPLSTWLKFEQTWLEIQLGQNLSESLEFCWKILGNLPPQPLIDIDGDEDLDDGVERDVAAVAQSKILESIQKQRAFNTVLSLAVRRTAKPAEVDRVLKFIDAGIAQGKAAAKKVDDGKAQDATSRLDSAVSFVGIWRNTKFRFLVALDRPDDLERELRLWIRDDVSTSPWRQSLARVLAERGQLDEAIQLFEACVKDKLLSWKDQQMLADWYLVSNRRAAYERSRIDAFKLMPEGQLGQSVNNVSYRWQQSQIPTELDEGTLFTFQALFEKSAAPEQYLWALQRTYAGSRDFRLLQMLPDAVLGRSPQQIYSFLVSLNNQVLYELRNEAAADEIIARIKTLRTGERTETDLRALDLLESLVERKSSELLNQPGPHIDACLAALNRAFARKWGDGEPVMMSHFLSQLGQLRDPLSNEQLRELKELQKLAPAQSRDHLHITNDYCNLLGTTYGRRDEAIQEMEIEVRNYSQANGGRWPHQDSAVLSSYVSLFEQAGRHAAGEAVLQKYVAEPEHNEQRKWLEDRLMGLYNDAFDKDGAVSLGSGRANLINPIYQLTLKQIDQSKDEHERYNLVARLMTSFDIAHRHRVGTAAEIMQKFAVEVMPAVLKRQTAQYRNTATAPLRLIGDLAGSKVALRYVVERMEQYPQRLQITWENSWQSFGYELARRREESGVTELDDRVLKLAIDELKYQLRSGDSRNQSIYYRDQHHFWTAKAGDFAKAAEAVLAERKSSGRRVMSVASYFWSGLHLKDRAIEILFVAHNQGILEESAQMQLVQWLHSLNRFAESISLLETLIVAHPHSIDYRSQLMTAYFGSQRPQQLADLIQQTHDIFHDGGRWTEGNVARLGHSCRACGQSELAVKYLTEAIALRQRAYPGSGHNDGVLASYYDALAHANSDLDRTREAVDASSAAIVCWSGSHGQRAQHLETLKQVLNASSKLDAYVASLDAETARSGQDSPIIRKTIGLIYQGRRDYPKAIAQLRMAVDLQPHDDETHKALMECYDATQNSTAGTLQLLKRIDLHRHELALYQQLADRLKGNEAEAERAATSIIEASPGEAENHAVMAELRQGQGRWNEAIPHWEQVAELRKLEPRGLLKLAAAQIHEKQWDAAKVTINRLRKTEWPARFNAVQIETRQLEAAIPEK